MSGDGTGADDSGSGSRDDITDAGARPDTKAGWLAETIAAEAGADIEANVNAATEVATEAVDGWSRPRVNKQVMARKRVPYFQRPKHPHDWRWWVGGVGRSLIITGLMMFAFVGYQLWGTGIETARAQASLEDEFNDRVAEVSTTTTAPPETVPGESTTTSTIPIAEPSSFENSDLIAQIIIPKMKLEYYVVEGVRMKDLKKGVGHFKETPMPGQLGNVALAGHRTTYGHPFYRLDDLHPGDEVTIKMVTGGTFVYRVTGKEIVEPNEYGRVIPTKDPDVATLTLATCHPVYTARQRLIVYATLVPELSDPVTRPYSVGTADPGGLPGESGGGDDSAATTIDNSVATSDTADTTVATDTAPVVTTPFDAGGVDPDFGADEADLDDGFSEGWFSDKAAIPHVIIWGMILALVAVAAYYAGKAARRLWVSFLVGFAPFLVVLYFSLQNVIRLLPPGL